VIYQIAMGTALRKSKDRYPVQSSDVAGVRICRNKAGSRKPLREAFDN
jgi:hypothetical protein